MGYASLDRVFQSLTRLKSRRFGRRDLDGLFCFGIAAGPGRAFFYLKCAKAHQLYLIAGLQCVLDHSQRSSQSCLTVFLDRPDFSTIPEIISLLFILLLLIFDIF